MPSSRRRKKESEEEKARCYNHKDNEHSNDFEVRRIPVEGECEYTARFEFSACTLANDIKLPLPFC